MGSSEKEPGGTALIRNRVRIVPVWDDEGYVNNLPYRNRVDNIFCDQHVYARPGTRKLPEEVIFDPRRLQEFKLYQKHLFEANRLTDLRDGNEVPLEYSDDEILTEMEQLYGPLDRSSEKFKALFGMYKSSFMEHVEECLENEEELKEELKMTGKDLVDLEFLGDSEIKDLMKKRFTALELTIMSSFDPRECNRNPRKPKAEWLVLPRPKASHGFGESYLAEWIEAAKDPRYNEDLLELNFALLDPKYIRFPRHAECDDEDVGRKLLMRINEVIDKYPSGTGDFDLIAGLTKTVRRLNLADMGFRGAAHFFASCPDVVCHREYQTPLSKEPEASPRKTGNRNESNSQHGNDSRHNQQLIIYFPAALNRYIVNIHTVLTRIRHFILVLLEESEHGILHAAEIQEQLSNVFGIEFDPMVWKFPSWRYFLDFAVVRFASDHVEVQELFLRNTRTGLSVADTNVYLVKRSEETMAAIEELVVPSPSYKFELVRKAAPVVVPKVLQEVDPDEEIPRPVPPGFLTPKDVFPAIADKIYSGQSFKCYILGIPTPSKLYVVLNEQKKTCLTYKRIFNEMKLRESPIPKLNQLVHGLPVIHRIPEGLNMIRRRGRVISVRDKCAEVQLLDTGELAGAEPKMLRFVPREVLSLNWPTQAVQCRLLFASETYRRRALNSDWSERHFKLINNIFDCNCNVYVTFSRKVYDKYSDENVWEVQMSIYNPESNLCEVESVAEAFERAAAAMDGVDVSKINYPNPVFTWYP